MLPMMHLIFSQADIDQATPEELAALKIVHDFSCRCAVKRVADLTKLAATLEHPNGAPIQ
jgi:hypothetical protein